MLRHLIGTTSIFHHHDTRYAEDTRKVADLKATRLKQLQVLGGLTDCLGIHDVVKHHDIICVPVLAQLLCGSFDFGLVGSAQYADGTRLVRLLLHQDLILTALSHILQSLFIGSSGDAQGLHCKGDNRQAHIHGVIQYDVLKVNDILRRAVDEDGGTVVSVICQVVCIGDGIITTTSA